MDIAVFEKQQLEVFKKIATITKQKKDIEEQEAKLKDQLQKAMEDYEITGIDNEYIKVSYVAPSSSTSVDLKKLEEKEPECYEGLIADYPKVTNRKGYLKFTVK